MLKSEIMRQIITAGKRLNLVLAFFVLFTGGFSQQTILISESFETGDSVTPPAGWVIEQVTGTAPGITFDTVSANPTVSAFDSMKFVTCHAFGIDSGSTRLRTTGAISTLQKSFVMVEFAWFENPDSAASADKVQVQWSTDSLTWNTAGTFLRYNIIAGWKMKNVVLPGSANNVNKLFIAFLFTTAGGNNCYLDKVRVSAGPPVPPTLITIGSGTTTAGWPFYTYFMGSRTQMLYTAAELTAAGAPAGSFATIGFNVASYSAQVMTNFTIKMGHTTSNTITSWLTTTWTTVYQTNYAVPGTGWCDITLTNPFIWNGTSNILVEVCFGNNGSYTANSLVLTTTVANRTVHYHNDNYAGCTGTSAGSVQATLPNIRFSAPLTSLPGALMGTVRDINTLQPVANAIVSVGTKKDTTDASGFYIIYNINPGTVNVTCQKSLYIAFSGTAVIVTNQVTTRDMLLPPGPRLEGIVTDTITGLPIVGAFIMVDGVYQTMTTGGGHYLTPILSVVGTRPVMISMTGYDSYISEVTLTANNTIIFNARMFRTVIPPGQVVAAFNVPVQADTTVDIQWIPPLETHMQVYDDGISDSIAVWDSSGNMNALKVSPRGYPASLTGGKIYLGSVQDYPPGSLPLTPFRVYAMRPQPLGGLTGDILDSVNVTPTGYGWAGFSFATPVVLDSGELWLVMKQMGTPSHAARLGVDLSTPSQRSWSLNLQTANGWVAAPGTFMIRSILQSPDPTSEVSYKTWRLRQGEESLPSAWLPVDSSSGLTASDTSWSSLSSGPYRWAVKSIFPPGQRLSAPSFSNAVGKNWTAPVQVCVNLSCNEFLKRGTKVKLVNTVYPDTLYIALTDTSGCVLFPAVWKGNYQMTVIRYLFSLVSVPVTITGEYTTSVNLQQNLLPAVNLVINDSTLVSSWNLQSNLNTLFSEQFTSGNFTANSWQVSAGTNWQISSGTGNPAPSAMFNWSPQLLDYHQYITSRPVTGHSNVIQLKYDIILSNYDLNAINYMSVELWDGLQWTVLKSYNTSAGSFPWKSETLDISLFANLPFIQFRFHAYGADSYSLNNWNLDNIIVTTGDLFIPPHPCVSGYNLYLNNVLIASTPDTNYTIPPGLVVYGQSYTYCVEAQYNSGVSARTCYTFISHFLYPPRNLAVVPSVNSAVAAWLSPAGGTGLTGYNLFRDGKKINITPIQALSYTDVGLPAGSHTYKVRAVYGSLESVFTSPVVVVINGLPAAPVTFAGHLTSPDSSNVAIPVTVNHFNDVTALSLRLEYNPEVLTYTGFNLNANQLNGLTIFDYPVSLQQNRLMFLWMGSAPLSLPDSTNLVDLYFYYNHGSTTLDWNNASNSGTDCEFSDHNGEAMVDIPSADYYMNGSVEGFPQTLLIGNQLVNPGNILCMNASQFIDVAGNGSFFQVLDGGSVTMAAGKRISLYPGVQVFDGGYLHAYIVTNNNYCGIPQPTKGLTGTNPDGNISAGGKWFVIYPNPAYDRVTLHFSPGRSTGETSIRVYNQLGDMVLKSKSPNAERITISVADLPKGLYFFHVTCGSEMGVAKVIRN